MYIVLLGLECPCCTCPLFHSSSNIVAANLVSFQLLSDTFIQYISQNKKIDIYKTRNVCVSVLKTNAERFSTVIKFNNHIRVFENEYMKDKVFVNFLKVR